MIFLHFGAPGATGPPQVGPGIQSASEGEGKRALRRVLQQQIQQLAVRHKAMKGCKATKLTALKGMQDSRLQH